MAQLFATIRAFPKRTTALVAMAVAVIAVPAVLHAWGPDRATYTINQPADHVTFNSITDNPSIGDERNFVGIRENGTNGLWQDNQTVEPGKEYVVRMYVHNNAAADLGLVAENVTAMFNLPTTTGKSIQVDGILQSSNATPNEVYDHATFTGGEDFNLAYVAGSAKYYNNANGNGFDIPESVFTSAGAKLGYDKLDGKIPGCFQYDGYLTFIVKPQFTEQPKDSDFTIKKQVRKAGESTWQESVEAQPGDKLNYRLTFTNTGDATLKNVNLKDTLPKHVSFVPGTARILNASNPQGANIQGGDAIVGSGVNIGSYTSGSNAIVVFDAVIDSVDKLACDTNTLRNIVSATPEGQNPKEDDATTTVTKKCEQPETKDITVCRLEDKKYPVTIKETEFDESKHSMNPADCKEEVPAPEKIEVCELDTKEVITINKDDFDTTKHSKNFDDCAVTPPVTPEKPSTPEKLPETGAFQTAAPYIGFGSLALAATYYFSSRRML